MPTVGRDSNHAKESAYGIRQLFRRAGQHQPDIANDEKAHHWIGGRRVDSAKYNSGRSEAVLLYRRRGLGNEVAA